MAPADVPGAGDMEWASVAGVPPGNPLISGAARPGSGFGSGIDPDLSRSLIVTQDATGGVRPGQAQGAGLSDAFDDWRDLFDFKNSPVPYVVLGFLVMIGFMAARLEVRGGPANLKASLG